MGGEEVAKEHQKRRCGTRHNFVAEPSYPQHIQSREVIGLPPLLPPLRLTGARVLRDGELQSRSISLADGRLMRGPFPEIDMRGFLILPGIVDLHCCGLEHQTRSRTTEAIPLLSVLAAVDREAAASGVTTAFLTQRWSWEGGNRGPNEAEALLSALEVYRGHALTNLHVQLRHETHFVESVPRLLATVSQFRIKYVVFNNHVEEGLRLKSQSPSDLTAWAESVGRSSKDLLASLDAASKATGDVPRSLCVLAEAFDSLGVTYGSHKDPDGETREYFTMIGARVAEFPRSRRAALAAKAMMCPVIVEAPDVVRGSSWFNNVPSEDFLAAGQCNALASVDQTPALAKAAWALVDQGLLDLPRAWALISEKPTEILRLPDRGRLQSGLRADLVVMNEETREIEATITGGRLAFLAGEAGVRFSCDPRALRMAAE